MLTYPEGFNVLKKLNKVLEKRKEPFEKEDGLVDWAQAEQLAFATILQDGTSIRLTGQDSERGTFSHRHAVLHDEENGDTFTPLHHVPDQKHHSIFITHHYQKQLLLVLNMVTMLKIKEVSIFGKHNMGTSQIWHR